MANGIELDDLQHLNSRAVNEFQESSTFLFPLSLQERIHDPTLFKINSGPPPERRSFISKYCTFSKESFQNYIYIHIPIFKWARDYNRTMIRPDLIAGLTIAVMTIPQGMVYFIPGFSVISRHMLHWQLFHPFTVYTQHLSPSMFMLFLALHGTLQSAWLP